MCFSYRKSVFGNLSKSHLHKNHIFRLFYTSINLLRTIYQPFTVSGNKSFERFMVPNPLKLRNSAWVSFEESTKYGRVDHHRTRQILSTCLLPLSKELVRPYLPYYYSAGQSVNAVGYERGLVSA